MIHPLNSATHSFPGSNRFLAVLAVLSILLLCSVQGIEKSHSHSAEESSAQCLLCKAGGESFRPSETGSISTVALSEAPVRQRTQSQLTTPNAPHPIRGPPNHS